MAPSATVNIVEPPQHELKKIESVVVKAVSPSPSTDDDHDHLPKLERMPQTVKMNGLVNGFRTPETIDSLDSDDPVVIVGMGK